MIDDGQCQMWMPLLIRLREEIAPPNVIAWHRARHAMFHLPPGFINEVLVFATGVGHIGLAHRHLSLGDPAPVEVMRDGPAAGLRHQRLEPDDLVPDPGRFRRSNDATRS